MKAIIEINMDNDAFEDAPSHELGRILGRLEDDVLRNIVGEVGHHLTCVDLNGNAVGKLEIVESENDKS
jgi:hypothetical protein